MQLEQHHLLALSIPDAEHEDDVPRLSEAGRENVQAVPISHCYWQSGVRDFASDL